MLPYVGVSVLLDRALAATVAAKGSCIFAQTILWKTSSMMTFWWTTVMSGKGPLSVIFSALWAPHVATCPDARNWRRALKSK